MKKGLKKHIINSGVTNMNLILSYFDGKYYIGDLGSLNAIEILNVKKLNENTISFYCNDNCFEQIKKLLNVFYDLDIDFDENVTY